MRREPSSAAAGGAKPWPRSTATANAQIPGILVIAFLLVGPFRTRPCVFPTPNAYLASSPAREARHRKFGSSRHNSVREFSLDFSNISVHRGRESEKDVVLQQFL